jgi:hypothetical protein
MSKRPRDLVVEIPEFSDDDDEELFRPTTFARTATITPATAEVKLTPLGTAVFPLLSTATLPNDQEEITMTLEEKDFRINIHLRNSQGQTLPLFLHSHQIGKIATILRQSEKFYLRGHYNNGTGSLAVHVAAKANRLLGSFEKNPLWDLLEKTWGTNFTRIRKVTPQAAFTPIDRTFEDSTLQRLGIAVPTPSPDNITVKSCPPDQRDDAYHFFHDEEEEDDQEDVETVKVEISEPDWEQQTKLLEQMFEDNQNKSSILPAFAMPSQLAHLHLFPHQIEGIRWLVHQERNNLPASWFTRTADNQWRDKITGSVISQRPKPIRGSILADDMGLG